jgi:hypothetical protein
MTSEELHRNHLAAFITGDLETAANLRQQFKPADHATAVEFLRAATAVTLEYRFGPGAGLCARLHHDELAAFMAELRQAGRASEPPPDYLAIEAVVRSLYGEAHLLEPLRHEQRHQALYTALAHQVHTYPWLAANPDTLIDRARLTAASWLLGPSTAS